jgi:hypothetical protein
MWLDDEGPVGEYVVIFSNNTWLRLLEVSTGKEFVSPASAVYRIENIVEPN